MRTSFMKLIGCSFCKWLGEITSPFTKNVLIHIICHPSMKLPNSTHGWLLHRSTVLSQAEK
jgi:hypothetical protein